MTLVSLRNVTKSYPARAGKGPGLRAVDDVSLDVAAGEIQGIIGYSGAGKSTLVRLINALEPHDSGQIAIDGQDITGLDERQLRRVRAGIGMIFQQFNLFGARTVRGNIAFPLKVAGLGRAERRARVDELLDFVGLSALGDRYPEQLSGGQKQRVGIARALATSPRILLADEATSALDPETTRDVLDLLARVNRELGVTIILITHEMEVIQSIASRVAVMEGGRIVEEGEVFDVFATPQHPATRAFVGTVIRGVPDDAARAALAERHGAQIATVSLHESGGAQAQIFASFADSGLGVELVYGGINDIRGRRFGHLTFALRGTDVRIGAALDRVATLDGVEVTR